MCSSEQWNNGAFLSFGYGVVATEIGLESNQGLGGTERSIKISHRQPHVDPEHPLALRRLAPTRLFEA
jgi:hypothetical protein